MNEKQSSLNRGQTEHTIESPKKRLIAIAIGVVALIALVVIAYFAWPKIFPVKELKIEDLVVGTGKEAKTGDTVTIEYTGWLQTRLDPVDSSYQHDKPFEFVLGDENIIAGWNQGIVGMKVGGKRKLTIPSELGYGAKGAGNGIIPPDAALIFELELVDLVTPTSVTELKIEDLVIGTGAEVKKGDSVSVHYTGWLEDGTQFASSHDSGEPLAFVLGQGDVIVGWDQGILGMKVGGKRRLTIPPDMAYGESGGGDIIPPNAALIFELELLEIK